MADKNKRGNRRYKSDRAAKRRVMEIIRNNGGLDKFWETEKWTGWPKTRRRILNTCKCHNPYMGDGSIRKNTYKPQPRNNKIANESLDN